MRGGSPTLRPGTGNEQVLELVALLDTELGAQQYELTLTSPRRAWLGSRAAFGEAMKRLHPEVLTARGSPRKPGAINEILTALPGRPSRAVGVGAAR